MNIDLRDIPIENIEIVENLRTEMGDLSELMQSIKQNGLLHPIGVYNDGGNKYVLCYGSRRLESFKRLGYKTIPALISDKKLTEQEFLIYNTVENIQRKDIDAIELGKICSRLHNEMNLSNNEIAVRLSIPKSRVESALDVFNRVPDEYKTDIGFVYKGVKKGKIPVATASYILKDKFLSKDMKIDLLNLVKKNDLSRDQIKLLIELVKIGMKAENAKNQLNIYKIVSASFIVNKNILENLMKKFNIKFYEHFFNAYITDQIYHDKDLFFDIKKAD